MSKRLTARTALAGAVVLLVVGGATAALASRTDIPSDEEIGQTVRAAVTASQNSFSTPQAVALGKALDAGHKDKTPEEVVSDPSSDALDAQEAKGASELAVYWTGPALAKQIQTQKRWIREQAAGTTDRDPNFRPLGGGVTDVKVTSVAPSDDGITVKADITQWAAMAQIDEDGQGATIDKPSNTLQATIELVQVGDAWKITTYDWDFAPGSSP